MKSTTVPALLIVGILFALAGCLEARRTYHYRTIVHPDGRIEKQVDVEILNSDMKLGQLEARGADGTVLKLSDLDAQERASETNRAAWETMGKVVDKIPAVPVPIP